MIICGTGHRPDKLGGYTREVRDRLALLAHDRLVCYSLTHPDDPVTEAVSGGALGWDQGLAEGAWRAGIPLTMALPFPGFEDRWPDHSKAYLYRLMDLANKVEYVCDAGYAGWKMQKRNEWMVDHADRVLALWNGTSGGTANCIGYANKVGKPIDNLWDAWNGS